MSGGGAVIGGAGGRGLSPELTISGALPRRRYEFKEADFVLVGSGHWIQVEDFQRIMTVRLEIISEPLHELGQ